MPWARHLGKHSGVRKRVVSQRLVLADVPRTETSCGKSFPEVLPLAEKSHDFWHSWTPKNGSRAHSPKPPNTVSSWIRNILVSVKLFVRNSGAGNGCANFMGAKKNAFFLQEKPMSIKFLLLGGVLGGGGGVPILFLWARGFFWLKHREGMPC